jgi:hypothetical protein
MQHDRKDEMRKRWLRTSYKEQGFRADTQQNSKTLKRLLESFLFRTFFTTGPIVSFYRESKD